MIFFTCSLVNFEVLCEKLSLNIFNKIMENYGLKQRKVYGCFELKFVTLLLVLIPCALTQEGFPSFNITCDSSGLYVKIAFSKPFNGTVYAKGYRFDPLCSMTESSALDGSLSLPLTACGTYVQDTNQPWITNTIVIQQHPLIRTVNDLEKSVICTLPYPFENFCDSTFQLDQIYDSSLPPTSLSDMFHENSATIFDNSFTRLIIFQLLNGTIYNDVGIKSCIAHNAGVLAENASVYQINNPEGCFTIDSENSNLTIIRTNGGLTAYVEMKNLEIEYSDNFYLTCEVFLCKTKCRCSETDQQMEHSTTLISHKLTKRSTDSSTEIVTFKQYEARTRFLKSTVKALMDKIMEQRKSNDIPKIRKRLMRLDDSSIPLNQNSFESRVIPSNEIFSPEPISNDFNEMEPHLVDDYEPDDYHPNDFHRDVEPDDYHPNDFRRDVDPDDSDPDYKDETSPITEFSTSDSDIDVVTLPKEFKADANETFSDEELQGKGTEVNSEGVASSENEATESVKADSPTSSVFPTVVEVSGDHLGSCIPKLRFVIVLIVMGFVIGSLILVSCGLALYIRKEKKRNRLNDFLLYSIGF